MSEAKPFLIVSEGESPWIMQTCETAEEAAHALSQGYRIYGLCSFSLYPTFDDYPAPPSTMAAAAAGRRAHMGRLRGELAALEEMEAADQAKTDPENQAGDSEEPAEESEVTW